MSDFDFTLYVDRFSGNRTYHLKRTESGWHISHIAINGDSKPNGAPFLYLNFEQDGVHYPSGIQVFLEHVWTRLKEGSLNDEAAQQRLQELADWVSACEKAQPRWEDWNRKLAGE
ncbi:hypothetical protein B9Z39_11525 [Limnohabitans sp. JirII-29]|uniref:hypothetical protein n=1 Tax=Limnohabitans sp. JirII-29 TaxID=1835756 RepID=UPI000D3BA2CD|nr:hypothetical protein [Limnohabitans sp. JirII-29]PUE26355.1 hypothetical protein B9Z39_11525 [Limnohabitans sp. JirII-29]